MPNTIVDNLQRLQSARTAIGNAITAKGGTVTEGDGFEDFPADIGTIQSVPSIENALKSTYPQITGITEKIIPYRWMPKTWNNAPTYNSTNEDSSPIWTDGTDIYYSQYSGNQYVLDKATSTWSAKTWGGMDRFYNSTMYGRNIWTDGVNIFNSYHMNKSYVSVLNRSDSTWVAPADGTTMPTSNNSDGKDIWTDGSCLYLDNYVYYPGAPAGYMYYSVSNTTTAKKKDIWTDGTDIYYRFSYKLAKVSPANVMVNTVKCIPQFIK